MVDHSEATDGRADRLSIDAPREWNVDDFSGHERMAVSRGNTLLRSVFEITATELPKLIAQVRWGLLRYPLKEFADSIDINCNAYKALEKDQKPDSKPHFSKLTRLIEGWRGHGISLGVREQLIDLLTIPDMLEASAECIDFDSALEYCRNQCAHLLSIESMNAFYHRIGCERGHEEVHRRFRPSFYNTIWQREKTRTVPTCLEVVECVQTMYDGSHVEDDTMGPVRMEQGMKLWREVKLNQYRTRTVEEPLAQLLVAIEEDLARHWQWNLDDGKTIRTEGVTLTAEALREICGLGPKHAQQLIQCEWIDPDAVQTIAEKIMRKGSDGFKAAYRTDWEAESRRENFGTLCTQAFAERGFSAADVAKLLGIKAPEERGGESAVVSEDSRGYRPDSEVRAVVYDNHVSRQLSVEALCRLLARDDGHAVRLQEAYIAHRTRFFRRSGATLSGNGLLMRIKRELANMPMKDLARHFLPKNKQDDPAALRAKDKELQHLERGEGKNHVIPFTKVFEILNAKASAEAEAALGRVDELNEMAESLKSFDTVAQMAANLIAGKGGAKFVSESMRNMARHDSEWLRYDLIQRTGEGDYVPSLSQLHLMSMSTLEAALAETNPEVIRDWYERYPDHLATEGIPNFGTVTKPLPRMLCTLIGTKEASPMRFFARVPGIVPTQGTRILRDLEEGNTVDWRHIHKILGPFSLRSTDLVYRFLRSLHESDDITASLREFIPQLKAAKIEIHPSAIPGLTLAELKPYMD